MEKSTYIPPHDWGTPSEILGLDITKSSKKAMRAATFNCQVAAALSLRGLALASEDETINLQRTAGWGWGGIDNSNASAKT